MPDGPFAGVPYLLKDLACEMKGVRFTEGSRVPGWQRVGFDSELVVRLRRAGLVILGKTNTPEFGMAPACEPCCSVRPGTRGIRSFHERVKRRVGRRGGVGHGAVRSRQRPGRFAAVPGVRLRAVRTEANQGPQSLGPEYGDVAAGGAVEHTLTRSVRDSAALLDATSGPDSATRTGRRLRIAPTAKRSVPIQVTFASPTAPVCPTATMATVTASRPPSMQPSCVPRSAMKSPKPAGRAHARRSVRSSAR